MPAVAEQSVVCPVGRGSTDSDHGQVIHKEHDHGKNRETEPAVCDDLIYLIGSAQTALVLFLVAALDYLGYVEVTLVGDYALSVVVQLFFGGLDVLLNVSLDIFRNIELFKNLVITLKNLDGIPALLLFGHIVHNGLFNVSDRMLNRTGECVLGNGFAAPGCFDCRLGSFHDALALQRRNLGHGAAKLAGQLLDVDAVAGLAHHVHHVHRDHHGDAELGELGGEVKVALKVGAVDYIQYCVGALLDQVITRHDLFQRVRGERVDTGKIHDDDVVMLFQLAFLFLHGDARPVADELVGAGQRIEQRGLAAVGVTGKSNFDLFVHLAKTPFSLNLFNSSTST